MDKDQIIKSIRNIFDVVADAFNRIKNSVVNFINRISRFNNKKERPKNVTNVYEYLEKKKKSEPFYKAVNGNRKRWE